MWKECGGSTSKAEELREVKREWSVEGSKTGKMQDECFEERLAWGEGKMGLKKTAIIHFKGGVDQLFREVCLASTLTRLAIIQHGHEK